MEQRLSNHQQEQDFESIMNDRPAYHLRKTTLSSFDNIYV